MNQLRKFALLLAAFSTILLVLMFLSRTPARVSAQTSTPVSTAALAPTPDATVTALQSLVATQEVEIQSLRRDLEFEVRDRKWTLEVILWRYNLAVAVGVVVAAILGFTSFQSIPRIVRRKVRESSSRFVYQLDVTNLDIYLQRGEHLNTLTEILKSQGLYRIFKYRNLGNRSLKGITIFEVKNGEDEKDYLQFINEHYSKTKQLIPTQAGFILYVTTNYRVNNSTIDIYPTTALANTPWNLASTLLVLGRHITAPPKLISDAEEDDEVA